MKKNKKLKDENEENDYKNVLKNNLKIFSLNQMS